MKCFCGKEATAKISRAYRVVGREHLYNPEELYRYDYLCECHTDRAINRMRSFRIEYEIIKLNTK